VDKYFQYTKTSRVVAIKTSGSQTVEPFPRRHKTNRKPGSSQEVCYTKETSGKASEAT
jgi:hypothetical protein